MRDVQRWVGVTVGDDRPDRRAALLEAVRDAGSVVVAEAATGPELLRLSLRHQPRIVIVDPLMRGPLSDRLIPRLLDGVPGAHVIAGEPAVYREANGGDRLHTVPGLVPAAVAEVLRRVPWADATLTGTAVVCLADPVFRTAVLTSLPGLGIAPVGSVTSAADAYRTVGDVAPDLLVMDLSLTGMGGWRYLQQLGDEHPDCRIVVTSPLGAVPLAVMEVGVSAVLAEWDITGLRATVRRLLDTDEESRRPVAQPAELPGDVSPDGRRTVNPPSS